MSVRARKHVRRVRRRGAASMVAMVFLSLFGTLSVAMISMSTLNARSAGNLADVERARAAAEAGLRFQTYRFKTMTNRPRRLEGKITDSVALAIWQDATSGLAKAITDDYRNTMTAAGERTVVAGAGRSVDTPWIDAGNGTSFRLNIRQSDARPQELIVTSTGRYGSAVRRAEMTFVMDKKIKFAIVGKVPIQIGRNTIVEGNVAMAVPNRFPPILMLSDFMHFDPDLKAKLDAWNAHLQGTTNVGGTNVKNHNGYDNRVNVNNPVEYQLAAAKGYTDVSRDGYIDEYDIFLKQYDKNADLAVSESEFTNPSTGKLYDGNLFGAMDATGAPWNPNDPNEPVRSGYRDRTIDNRDGYAKVRGTLTVAANESVWAADLATQGKRINDMIQGTVAVTTPTDVAVKFGATQADLFDLAPENFEQAAANFRTMAQNAGGSTVRTSTRIEKAVLSPADANGGTTQERTPFGSTSFQATYQRPVFRNMAFKNVVIPKGLNALFDNCTFEGVTFVETERDITRSNNTVTTSQGDGMQWAQRKVAGDNFSSSRPLVGAGQAPAGGQTSTHGSTKGNNLRFNDCTFKGPVAGNYATAYTHFANSWEFTGKTLFKNEWTNADGETTATIVSPQVNIEMGSFTDPNAAPSTLTGVVVAGNIDIRGYSTVDGSIIITGDGAGNTTLAYFGASDSDTNAGAMPEGGYGKLNIRYNPFRALPDGINVPIDVLPKPRTYVELMQ